MGDVSDNDKTTDRTTEPPRDGADAGDPRPVAASSSTTEPARGDAYPVRDVVEELDDVDDEVAVVPAPGTGEDTGAAAAAEAERLKRAKAEAEEALAAAGAAAAAEAAATRKAEEERAAAEAGEAGTATEHLDLYALSGRAAPQRIDPQPTARAHQEPGEADEAGERVHHDNPHDLDRTERYRHVDEGTAATGTAVTGAALTGVAATDTARERAGSAETEIVGMGDLHPHEPSDPTEVYAPVEIGDDDAAYAYEDDELAERPDPRRGTLDLGLLLLRLGVGALLLAFGLGSFFGIAGAPTIGGLEAEFSGYRYFQILAIVVPAVQVIAGALLILGLATPLGAALALGISLFGLMHAESVTGVRAALLGAGGEPVLLPALLSVAALALQFTGPGRYGLDFSRTWSRRPLASSWIFCILAIAAAVALWWLVTGALPFAGAA